MEFQKAPPEYVLTLITPEREIWDWPEWYCESRLPAGVVMITMQRLVRYVAAEPFRPFRISMASGQVLEIRHPEMISVGRSTAHIYTILSDEPEPGTQREHEVSLLLMESIEPLEVPSAQDGGQ